MNTRTAPEIGAEIEGGTFAGLVLINVRVYGIVVAPKKDGETRGRWNESYVEVLGARSYCDGAANTAAMAAAGSEIAKWARKMQNKGEIRA